MLGLLAALVTGAAPLASGAVTSGQPRTEEQGLILTPPVVDLSGAPQEKITQEVRIFNRTGAPVPVTVHLGDFYAADEYGTAALIDEQTPDVEIDPETRLATWMSVTPRAITLAPEQETTFQLTIDVPALAEGGSRFGLVMFRTVPPPLETTGVSIAPELRTLILFRNAGDVMEKLELESFAPNKTFFVHGAEISFETRIRNSGNVHLKPDGALAFTRIRIKNMFGQRVADVPLESCPVGQRPKPGEDICGEPGYIIPNSIRLYRSVWQPKGYPFGWYTAELMMTYGTSRQAVKGSARLWGFPTDNPVVLSLLFLLLLLLILLRRRLRDAFLVLIGKDPRDRRDAERRKSRRASPPTT